MPKTALQNWAGGKFYPPHAKPLKGTENVFYATWKFMRNPVEGFGPLAYTQPIVSVKSLGVQMHVISDPAGMAQVLTQHAAAFKKSPLDQRIMGSATREGLLSVHDEQWRRQRRAVAPMFKHRHMADLAPDVNSVISAFSDSLGSGGEIELSAAMADVTFDVLAKALLGDPQGLNRETLRVATRRVVTAAGTLRPDDLIPWTGYVPRPVGPRGVIAIKRLREAADDLLTQRQDGEGADDLVSLLVEAKDPKTGTGLSRREQRDNLIGFFIAGHETTALTLTWALYLLGMDKAVQTRLRNEVNTVAGPGDVQYEDLAKLEFTRAVIDETMRLFPPAPVLARQCLKPVEVCGRNIEAGDIMILANYVMHRTERLWDDPLAFDPDRFIRQPELRTKGAAFMPFGGGPRICVGAAFAVMEAVMVLANLMRDYEIDIAPDCYPRPKMTVTLRPEGGIKARLKRI
jgi:cytochrome P450